MFLDNSLLLGLTISRPIISSTFTSLISSILTLPSIILSILGNVLISILKSFKDSNIFLIFILGADGIAKNTESIFFLAIISAILLGE